MNVILMGPPGCGKGTQANELVAARGLAHVSTGNILRAAVRAGNELGRKVASILDAGELVPDELMSEVLREALEAVPADRGWLLDGYPRTAPQAESLIGLLEGLDQGVDAVVSIRVPDEEIVARLAGRLTCPACGFVAAGAGGGGPAECPRCGHEMGVRDDDRPETVRNRLRVFREKTAPAEEILARRYPLKPVDGTGSPEEVSRKVALVLAD